MISERYQNAISEVLEYLKVVRKEDVEKISNSFMNFLNENASKTYKSNCDFSKPLSKMDILPETKAIIAVLCYKYWCEDEIQKKEFSKLLNVNSEELQKELKEKYNIDVFENKPKEENKEVALVVANENKKHIYIRVFEFFKKLLRLQ